MWRAPPTLRRDSGATSQEPVADRPGSHRRPAHHRKCQQKGNCDDAAAGEQRVQGGRGGGRGTLTAIVPSAWDGDGVVREG